MFEVQVFNKILSAEFGVFNDKSIQSHFLSDLFYTPVYIQQKQHYIFTNSSKYHNQFSTYTHHKYLLTFNLYLSLYHNNLSLISEIFSI